jgi:hypothetical protein
MIHYHIVDQLFKASLPIPSTTITIFHCRENQTRVDLRSKKQVRFRLSKKRLQGTAPPFLGLRRDACPVSLIRYGGL